MPDPYPLDRPTHRGCHQSGAGVCAQPPQAAALVQDERCRVRPPRGRLVDGSWRALLRRLPDGLLVHADVRSQTLRGGGDGGSLDDLAPDGGGTPCHA